MRTREYYYTSQQYDSAGIEPFQRHVYEYLQGKRTVPVSRAPSIHGGFLCFTFSNDLYRVFVEDYLRIKKPYECALKYGFCGYSKGGKNGIFYQLKKDSKLMRITGIQTIKKTSEIIQDQDIPQHEMVSLKNVKIVYHDLSGERVIGVMNKKNSRVIFIGFATY